MIPESDKNTIFFSSLFARHYATVYEQIKEILEYNGIANGLLTNTSDYWCRDYMPIQVGGDLMYQPVYFPDYLRGDQKYRTKPGIVKPSLKVNLRKYPTRSFAVLQWCLATLYSSNGRLMNMTKLLTDTLGRNKHGTGIKGT